MKKLFISQPMGELSDEEIFKARLAAIKLAEDRLGEKCEVIDSFIKEDPPKEATNEGLWYLGKSLELLAEADIAFFAPGWQVKRGCIIEHMAAEKYGIPII